MLMQDDTIGNNEMKALTNSDMFEGLLEALEKMLLEETLYGHRYAYAYSATPAIKIEITKTST